MRDVTEKLDFQAARSAKYFADSARGDHIGAQALVTASRTYLEADRLHVAPPGHSFDRGGITGEESGSNVRFAMPTPLTDREIESLQSYVGHNKALRRNQEISGSRLEEVNATRRTLDRLPAHEDVVYRDARLSSGALSLYREGAIVRDPQFISATTNPDHGFEGNFIARIHSRTGRDVTDYTTGPAGGRTVLFRDGTPMQVIERRDETVEEEIRDWGKYRKKVVSVDLVERPDLSTSDRTVADVGPTEASRPPSTSEIGIGSPIASNTSPFKILDDSGESGDGHVAPRVWGKYGAAGIMVRHVADNGDVRYLMTKSSPGSSQGKWQLPGGALNSLETPAQGAAREMGEETGVRQDYLDKMKLDGVHVVDGPNDWKYSNIAATAPERFEPTIDGHETDAAGWVPHDELIAMAHNGELHSVLTSELESILRLFDRAE